MGSCYSCNSKQQFPTYTTVNMANTNPDSKLVDPLKSRVSPYTRGSVTSFGFNKKRIPATAKSLSQDRTNETINSCESKIANTNANIVTGSCRTSPRHNKYSHIPRFGFKAANSTNSLGSSEELDLSNSSLNNSDANSNNIIEKCTKPLANGLKTRFTETPGKDNIQQIIKRCNQDNSLETQLSKGLIQTKEPITNKPKSGASRIATFTSGIKQPSKMIIQTTHKSFQHVKNMESGDNKIKINKYNIGKAPLARFDDVEAMRTSSDTLPDDDFFDSGLGTSVSDYKKEGDNETLVEVSELASDNTAGTTEKDKEKKVSGINSVKLKNEITMSLPTAVLAQKKNELKAADLMEKITSRFHQEDDFRDFKEEKTSSNENMKFVNNESKRLSVDLSESKQSSAMRSSTGSVGSPVDMDALSPPSERDTFLIDDEICDQPQLIQCQSPDLSSFLHSQDIFGHNQDSILDNGGKECMAFRSRSSDTLSSSSSIDSNDLMLDFDQGDDNTLVENLSRRLSCEECDQNTLGNMKSKEQCRHRSKNLLSHYDSSLIDEWNNLIDIHSKDGRTRRLRSATCPDTPTSSETRVLRPPRKMSAVEMDDGGVFIDPSSYRLLSQDVTNLKTMLLKLKRALQEAETLNPFECHSVLKNGLFHNLAQSDPPYGLDNQEEISQENVDLCRQVVFLQQQLDEKDRTIHLLQQQMTKYTISKPSMSTVTNSTNAATQTEKPRLSLTSMSQTLEESSFGTTVSSKNKSHSRIPNQPNHLSRQNNVTQSLNALPTVKQLIINNSTDQILQNCRCGSVKKSASAGDLYIPMATKDEKKNSQQSNIASHLPKTETAVLKKESSNSRLRCRIVALVNGQKCLKYSQEKKRLNN